MKVAFVIQAHANPSQLARFVDRIYGYGDIFIHIDAKFNIFPFVQVIGNRARFISNRCNVTWGSSSQLESYFELLKEALKNKYDYYSLHSGADYPCRSMAEFLQFIEQNKGEEFVSCGKMPENFLFRYKKFFLNNLYKTTGKTTVRDKIIQRIENIVNSTFPERKEYKGWPPYLGANWNTITHAFAESALKYWESNISLRINTYFTAHSDEWFMQTYGQACGFGKKFSSHGDLRYIDWSTNGAHPANLTVKDFQKIIDSRAFFARKMTADSESLLDMLDSHIGYVDRSTA